MRLLAALYRSLNLDVGQAMQRGLVRQKQIDMWDVRCQTCGGSGVVIDLANRWYVAGGEMVYGAKACPECWE